MTRHWSLMVFAMRGRSAPGCSFAARAETASGARNSPGNVPACESAGSRTDRSIAHAPRRSAARCPVHARFGGPLHGLHEFLVAIEKTRRGEVGTDAPHNQLQHQLQLRGRPRTVRVATRGSSDRAGRLRGTPPALLELARCGLLTPFPEAGRKASRESPGASTKGRRDIAAAR